MTSRALPLALLGCLALGTLAGLVPLPATAQGDPRPDLAVLEFRLVGPVPGWTDGVPNSTRLQATVVNVGATHASYRIDYSWQGGNGSRPLNEDASASVDVGAPLAPGARATHPPLEWRLQPGQAGDGFATATVRAYATEDPQDPAGAPPLDAHPANDARSIPLFVAIHRLVFSMEETPAEVPPDGAGFVRLTARNDGNVAEAVPLRLLDPPHDARVHSLLDPAALVLPVGATSNATLFVDYAPAGDFSPFALRYVVEAAPPFAAPLHFTTPLFSSGPENPEAQEFRSSATIDPDSLQVPIGGQAMAWLTVANDGAHDDTYTIGSTTDPGWTVSAAGRAPGASLRIGLRHGEETRIPLTVQAPATVAAGTSSRIEVRTTSDLVASPRLVVLQAQVPGAILSLDALQPQVAPLYTGDNPRILVVVANHGTHASGAGQVLHLKATMPGIAPLTRQASIASLAPGASVAQAFDLPPFGNGGPLQLEASLQNGQGIAAEARVLDLLVHQPILALRPARNMTGGAGETVAYRIDPHAFVLGNLGNAVERVAVSAVAAFGEAAIEGEPTVDLAPGEWRTVPVLHKLPSPLDGHAASNLTVVARIAGRPGPTWLANTTTFLLDQEGPRLRLAGTAPAIWVLDRPLRIDAVADDDDKVLAVQANVTAPSGMRTVVALSHAGDGHWTAHVPLVNGTHRIDLAATDRAGHWANLTFRVEGRKVPPPSLALEGLSNATTGNGAAVLPTDPLRLFVEDAVGVAEAWVEVRQAGPPLRRALAIQDGVAAFDLRDAAAGPAELRLEVTNLAGATSTLTYRVDVLGPTAVAVPNRDLPTPAMSRGSPGPSTSAILAALALAAAGLRRTRT